MQDVWNRIESWLAANAPDALDSLNPGVSETDLAEAEAFMRVKFPAELRASLLIHDGQTYEGPWLIGGWQLMPLEQLVSEWRLWQQLLEGGDFDENLAEPDEQIEDSWWNPAWVPVTYDGSGNFQCVDMAPAEAGQVGQVITVWHDEETRRYDAPGFRVWLERYASDLEAGRYVPTSYAIVDKEDI